MGKAVKAVFGIDMETDVGSWTPFYEGLVNGTPRLMDMLAKRGVTVTTFWVAEAARNGGRGRVACGMAGVSPMDRPILNPAPQRWCRAR